MPEPGSLVRPMRAASVKDPVRFSLPMPLRLKAGVYGAPL